MPIEILPRPASRRTSDVNALDHLAERLQAQQAAADALPFTMAEFCEAAIALHGRKFPLVVRGNGRVYRIIMIGGQPVARELPLSKDKDD